MFDKKSFIDSAMHIGALEFGNFVLKSKRPSPYFFNAGKLASGDLAASLGAGYAQSVRAHYKGAWEDLVVFGAAYKGIPLAALCAYVLHQVHHKNIQWAYNRKETKDHGEGGALVGASLKGKQVWLVDDVMTAGTALKEAIALIESQGGRIAGISILLDRQEKGDSDQSALQSLGARCCIPVHALLNLDDLVAYLVDQNSPHLKTVQDHRDTYGAAK